MSTIIDHRYHWNIKLPSFSVKKDRAFFHQKVMIIDDCQDSLNLMNRYLQQFPVQEVVSFQDEDMAINYYSKERPELIIIDYNLNRMKGTMLADILDCMSLQFIPILFISSSAKEDLKLEQLSNPYVSYAPKPLEKDTFQQKVLAALNYF